MKVATVSATQQLLRFGVFELNLDTEELRKSGEVVKVSPQPLRLLILLASHAGQVVTREEIQQTFWGKEADIDFERRMNQCVQQVRIALGDNALHPLYVETVHRHGYRFIAPVESKSVPAPAPRIKESSSSGAERDIADRVLARIAEMESKNSVGSHGATTTTATDTTAHPGSERRRRGRIIAGGLLLLALVGGVIYWRAHKAPVLTEKDTIVLADFDNKTDDTIFDETLKQGLAIELEQSPFLNVLSDRKVGRILRLMNRSGSEQLTEDVAREVCLRTNSKAVLTGSITAKGSHYMIGLRALNCKTGALLAEAQEQASGNDSVLKALDAAAVSVRGKLGESLSSVQKYATPLIEATTPSLEALKAYSLGRKTAWMKGDTAALPLFERAVEIDPNFALAYAGIAITYGNLNEVTLASENARIAYELRQKVSERERLAIEAEYYTFATGELDKAAQAYELWQEIYPRDVVPYSNLGFIYGNLGNWERVLEEAREAMRLEPNSGTSYANLGNTYESLNRLDEAEEIYNQAAEHKLEGKYLLGNRYQLAFLRGDTAQMAQLVSIAAGKPGADDFLLASQADTEAWFGKFKNAHDLSRRAMDSAQRNGTKEGAAAYQVAEALRQSASGNVEQALADARAAVELARNRDVRAMAALAFAQAGDTVTAEKLAAELGKAFPLDTLVQSYWLPTIHAAVALQRKDPNRAVELLKAASAIELGQPTQVTVYLCPVYLRGEAYLKLHDGSSAAGEFQKFIDHRGLVVNFPWGSLAHLGLARAYAAQGDTARAQAAYQTFLRVWKDADPDIPIYKQAKAEYAKLQ